MPNPERQIVRFIAPKYSPQGRIQSTKFHLIVLREYFFDTKCFLKSEKIHVCPPSIINFESKHQGKRPSLKKLKLKKFNLNVFCQKLNFSKDVQNRLFIQTQVLAKRARDLQQALDLPISDLRVS